MLSDRDIQNQLPNVLSETDFSFLGERYIGKVRDNYTHGEERVLITSDRLSCFDVVVTSIPFKGQVLNQLAVHWFTQTRDIVENHVLDVPDPNVIIARTCNVLPIEVVVRAYLTGSAWRDYEAGRTISGISLPKGLRPSAKLPHAMITPSTKAAKGAHDEPISESEILERGIVERKLWEQVRETALALFERGQVHASEQGLLLVDTKYEFGLWNGKLLLVDEIHTLDSSRYWVKQSYQSRFERGESPEMLDKEPTRQWLLSCGYKGDGPIPHFSDDHRVEIAKHYIKSFELIAGRAFEAQGGNVTKRIEQCLRKYYSVP